jgi:hypothetical protein
MVLGMGNRYFARGSLRPRTTARLPNAQRTVARRLVDATQELKLLLSGGEHERRPAAGAGKTFVEESASSHSGIPFQLSWAPTN